MKRQLKILIISFFSSNLLSAQADTNLIQSLNKVYYNNVDLKDSVFNFTNFKKKTQSNLFPCIGLNEINNESNLESFSDFSSSQFSKYNSNYFISEIPIVKALYLLGSNKEQIFNVNHSQFFSNRIGYSINYERIRSEGFYKNQFTEMDNFDAVIFIISKNKFFLSGITFNFKRNNREENGGIFSDSLFESGTYFNNKLYEVNLTEAQNIQLNIRQGIKNKIIIGKNKKNYLLHEFYYASGTRNYFDDPTSSFYSSTYFDSLITKDVFQYSTLGNELGANIEFLNTVNVFFSFKINNQKYSDNYFDTSTINFSFLTKLEYEFSKKIINKFEFNYYLTGYNSNDFYLKNSTFVKLNNDNHLLKIDLFAKKQKPYINNLIYNSNNFIWKNNFSDNISINSTVNYSDEKYKFDFLVEYENKKNFIYYNSFSRPEQYNGSITSINLKINKTFNLSKWSLENKLIFQYVSNKDIVRVPEFITKNSIYYNSSMWSMRFKTGMNLFYYTSYYSNAFSPSLQAFYIQNEKKIGNYPYLGIYFEGKIRSVNFYFAIQHINEGLQKRTYYSTLHYPMNDRTFQFGISWEFKD